MKQNRKILKTFQLLFTPTSRRDLTRIVHRTRSSPFGTSHRSGPAEGDNGRPLSAPLLMSEIVFRLHHRPHRGSVPKGTHQLGFDDLGMIEVVTGGCGVMINRPCGPGIIHVKERGRPNQLGVILYTAINLSFPIPSYICHYATYLSSCIFLYLSLRTVIYHYAMSYICHYTVIYRHL